jgi:hypothetical protein
MTMRSELLRLHFDQGSTGVRTAPYNDVKGRRSPTTMRRVYRFNPWPRSGPQRGPGRDLSQVEHIGVNSDPIRFRIRRPALILIPAARAPRLYCHRHGNLQRWRFLLALKVWAVRVPRTPQIPKVFEVSLQTLLTAWLAEQLVLAALMRCSATKIALGWVARELDTPHLGGANVSVLVPTLESAAAIPNPDIRRARHAAS